jgi:hypothetical protein
MIIRRQVTDQTLVINTEQDFQADLGWESNLMQFEEEVLKDIVNPIENYETVRYIHSPYTSSGITQTDIWFYFYFIGSGGTYVQDYQAVGISNQMNEQLLPQSTKSFFRLELFKTPGIVVNNVLTCEPPTRQNRKLVFAKNLSLPIGEKVFDSTLNGNIHIPIFTGSNYRNKENMYMFWFADESVLTETNLSGSTTGNTFFMTAKFYDAENGDKLDFTNDAFTTGHTINEAIDMYYQVDINKLDYSYKIYKYNGVSGGSKVGTLNSPIKFYEKGGAVAPNLVTPTPTPTATRSVVTPTPTPTLTPTPSKNSPYPGVNTISLSSGYTIANACTGTTRNYYYSGSFINGAQLWLDPSLNTDVAPGYVGHTVYYYSPDFNSIYYINDSEGHKYSSSEICPTPTPVTNLNSYWVSTVNGPTAAACGGDQDLFGTGQLTGFTIYGSSISGICDATMIVDMPSVVKSEVPFNTQFWVGKKIGGNFYYRKYIRDSSGTSATPVEACVIYNDECV